MALLERNLSRQVRKRNWLIALVALQLMIVLPLASNPSMAAWEPGFLVTSGTLANQQYVDVDGENVYVVYTDMSTVNSVFMRWYNGTHWSDLIPVGGTQVPSSFPKRRNSW